MPVCSNAEVRTETTRLSPAETVPMLQSGLRPCKSVGAKSLPLCKIVPRLRRGESLEPSGNRRPRQIAIVPALAGKQNSAYRYETKNMKNPLSRGDFSMKTCFLFE